MGRVPRPIYAGATYHVFPRANTREVIFRDEWDVVPFLTRLEEVVQKLEWTCHLYCVMGTHYHLCVHTPTPSIARGMHLLNASYAQRFNRRYCRRGHVFHGPYGAELVTDDVHLLELSRYLALNPVRAGLCRRPQDWAWSSYRAMAGFESGPSWLERSFLLGMFSTDQEQAEGLYRAFVEEGLRDARRTDQVPGHDQGPGPQTGPPPRAADAVRPA
jgi:putative transposase